MNPYIILFIIKIYLCVTECRVFCQDAHASPWIPLGYSCPVMCQNIINAIEKLKMMDYRVMIESDRKHKVKLSSSYISSVINSLSSESSEASKGELTNDYKPDYYYGQTSNKLLRDQRYIREVNVKRENKKWPNKLSVEIFKHIDHNDIEDFNAKQDGGMSYENKYEKLQPLYNILNYGRNNTGYRSNIDGTKKKKHSMTFTKTAGNVDQLEMELRSVLGNTTCDWPEGGSSILIRKVMRKCYVGRRNGYGDDFLRTLTKTMNRYSEASFEFTEDMVQGLTRLVAIRLIPRLFWVEIPTGYPLSPFRVIQIYGKFQLIMDRVFGTGIRASGDLLDVSKLLHYLRNAVEKHKMHRSRDVTTIVLKPRHCLPLSIPGCFCRPGFVEKAGQCVHPSDCDIEPSNAMYLTRIIVH